MTKNLQDRILWLNGEIVPVLEIPKQEDTSCMTFGEKVFYKIMRMRSAIRDTLPSFYKFLNGYENYYF